MSMLTLNGTVTNIYQAPAGVNKQTGEKFGGQHRIQLMCENILQNGEKRIELIDLNVDNVDFYRSAIGKAVRVPVGVYVSGNKPAFYALRSKTSEAQAAA